MNNRSYYSAHRYESLFNIDLSSVDSIDVPADKAADLNSPSKHIYGFQVARNFYRLLSTPRYIYLY